MVEADFSSRQDPVDPAEQSAASGGDGGRQLCGWRPGTAGGRLARSRRQVFVGRGVAHFGHEIEAAALGDELRDRRVRVVEIAEMPRPRRGRSQRRRERGRPRARGLVVDAVDAERAFLHDACIVVELARAIGAGPGAQLAADAEILVDEDDAVLARACRRRRSDRR